VNEENEGIPVTKICDRFGKSTVAYYKNRKARARLANKEDFILLLARLERMVNPMAGCKKVLLAIRPEMEREGVSIGINRFYDLMRRNGMMLPKRKKCSCTTKTEGPLEALRMAAKAIGDVGGVVAHSDRGCQYASHAYRELLDALGWKSSMTERLNGILKGEYFLDRHFKTKAEARKAIEEAIWVYNHRRLHESLGYKTPAEFRAEWKEVA